MRVLAITSALLGLGATVVALSFACDDAFVPSSVLTSFRPLAVRAVPPLVRPGTSSVALDALVFDPTSRPITWRWLACDPPATPLEPTPCDDGPTILRLQDEVLPELPAGIRLLGTSSTAAYGVETGDGTAIILLVARAGEDVVTARKELIVSNDPSVVNTNPVIDLIVVDGWQVKPGVTWRATLEQRMAWSAILTSTSADGYSATRPDGTSIAKVEDVRLAWFTTAGQFGTGFEPPSAKPIIDAFVDAGPPPPDVGPREGGGESSKDEFGPKVTLTMPERYDATRGPVRVFVVALDGRGGTAWTERDVTIRP